MTIIDNDDIRASRHAELDPVSRAKMERCANFLVRMVEKYGKEVLAEIEAEEKNKELPSN